MGAQLRLRTFLLLLGVFEMKMIFERCISLILSVCMLLGLVPFLGFLSINSNAANYEVGQIIEFGSYPQSEVTDNELLASLNSFDLEWLSFGYDCFVENPTSNINAFDCDCIKYADVVFDGKKYRAVIYSHARTCGFDTFDEIDDNGEYFSTYLGYEYANTNANGYCTDTIYWFKYEPLRWVLIDAEASVFYCENIIDSQPYNDYVCANLFIDESGCYYDSSLCINLSAKYNVSSIRQWLNNDFINTAFNEKEKTFIKTNNIDNGILDYVFLPTKTDLTNAESGFDSDYSRICSGSDYARFQGLYNRYESELDIYPNEEYSKYYGKYSYWLQSSSNVGGLFTTSVTEIGCIDGYFVYSPCVGVRPALRLNLDKISNPDGTFCGKLESSGIVVDLDNGESWVSPVVIDGVEYNVKKNLIPDSIKDIEGQDVVFTVKNGEILWFSPVWDLVNKISCNLLVTDEITYSGKKYSVDEINATVKVNSLYKGENVSELKGISELGVAVSSVKLKSSNPDLLNFNGEAETTVLFNSTVPIGGSASQNVKINVDSSYKISDLIEKEIVTISCDMSAAGDGKLIEKTPAQKKITVVNKNYEKPVVENNSSPEITDSSASKAATELNKITSSVTIVPSTELESIFTSEQIKAIGDLVLCEAVMASAPADTFERVLTEKVISEVYGYSNGLFTLTNGSLTFPIATENKNGEKVTVEFKSDYNSYLVGQVQGTIYYRITKPASMAQESYRTIGHISQVDISAFSKAAYALAESEIKNAVKPWGDKVDWATDLIFGKTVNMILKQTKWGSASGLVWDIITSAAKSVKIECPVDVYVYNSNDELVAAVEDNEVILTSDKANITVNGDTKYVTLFDESYYIVYEATSDGTMRVTVNEHANSEDVIRTVVIDEIPLESGAVFSQNIDGKILEESDYSITADDETVYTPDTDETTFHYHETDGEWFEGKLFECTQDGWNYTQCNICGDWYKEIILCEGHTDKDNNGYCDAYKSLIWQTITWNADGEETKTICKEGAEITLPQAPQKTGYTFVGWTPQIPDAMPAEDLTFTAVFMPNTYNAVFNADGGAWADGAEDKTVATEFDSEIIASEIPEKQGYVFSHWSPEVGIMDCVEGKTFTAVWLAATDTRYSVETYIMNTSGEYEKSVQNFAGTTDSTVNAEYSIENGFALNAENSVLSGTVAADNSLVLKVYIDRNSYIFETIVDGVSTETEYLYGAMVAEPLTPVKEGYKFIEWSCNIPETMPAEDVTITAVFENSYICPDCGNEILGEDAIEAHMASEARMKAKIRISNNSGAKTINYGETLKLTAIVTDMPVDAAIAWYVDGVKKGEGEIFNVTFESGTKTVEVKIVDINGNPINNADGNEIADFEKVTVNSGLWQKIVSFFKNLFKVDRTVIQ